MDMALCYGMAFGSIALLGVGVYQLFLERANRYVTKRVDHARVQLEDMFMDVPRTRLILLYAALPAALALAMGLATRAVMGVAVGGSLGLALPGLSLKLMRAARHKKFHDQLVDTLLQISSSLRAGLSMLQTFAVVAEEMPSPSGQEFALVLKETRMGVTLEEAMLHLKARMPSDDMNLFVTTVLVSRETGGDVTAVFTRLVETLRERKKLKERIKSLTLMPRMQALIMACIPFVFMYVTYAGDPRHAKFFFTDPLGKLMFGMIVVVQIISWMLFMRFSRSPI